MSYFQVERKGINFVYRILDVVGLANAHTIYSRC